MKRQKRGKLLVIEGIDGSGKGTQSAQVRSYLEERGIPFLYVDFPDYDSFYGRMVAQFLRGEYGRITDVSPYLASLLFALDRKDKQTQITEALNKGTMVLANRYVTSNIAHQGSKITNTLKRTAFIKWVEQLEYKENHMPHEDLVIYLKVTVEVSQNLTKTKNGREYLRGRTHDIHEKDPKHLIMTEMLYSSLAKTHSHWVTIDCVKHGTILSKEEIFDQIIMLMKKQAFIS